MVLLLQNTPRIFADLLPVRLFHFLPGSVVEKFGYSSEIYEKIGQLVAKVHIATRNFQNPAYKQHQPFMCWERAPAFVREIEMLHDSQNVDSDQFNLVKNSLIEFQNFYSEHGVKLEWGNNFKAN